MLYLQATMTTETVTVNVGNATDILTLTCQSHCALVLSQQSTQHNRALRVVIKLRAAKDVETKNSRNEMCVRLKNSGNSYISKSGKLIGRKANW